MNRRFKMRLIGIAIFSAISVSSGCTDRFLEAASRQPPNIVIVLADDLDMTLMPHLKSIDKYIRKEGITFTNFFVTSPLCCPSRSSLLRGQYPHNTGVLSNGPPNGGFKSFYLLGNEAETLAVWLNGAGYNTALFGKYLNGYPITGMENYIPSGWTDWGVFNLQNPSQNNEGNYYDYLMNRNGQIIQYGGADQDYSTDVIKNLTINFINRNAVAHTPFFVVASVYAPHGPSIPATRHQNTFPNLIYPKKPSFNEFNIDDKPSLIQYLATSGDEVEPLEADQQYIRRVQSLQAVDELVEAVVDSLKKNNQLVNTYIFITSDNGFHIGEHKLPPGKGTPYDEDINVPLLIRGPGIDTGITVDEITANIDIAPTILDLADIEKIDFIDGRSLMPLFNIRSTQNVQWRLGVLIEMGSMDIRSSSSAFRYTVNNNNSIFGYKDKPSYQTELSAFRGVQTKNYKYVEYFNGEIEFYDLQKDPYELENISSELLSEEIEVLHSWLYFLSKCESDNCRRIEEILPQIIN